VKVLDTVNPPIPGKDLMLTIDAATQRMAVDALTWGMQASGVQEGVTMVMNPQTGEILAMASLPAYRQQQVRRGHQRQ